MQIGSNEVAEFYRINTFKHIVCSRLFIGRPSFTTTMVWTFKSTLHMSHMSFTKEFYRHWSHLGTSTPLEALDKLWEALQCLPMQGWVVQRSLQWYHLSSSNLKLFLVWTQLCQAGKLFFASSLYFLNTAHHLTGCNDMPWPSHWRMHWQCIWHCMWFLRGIESGISGRRKRKRPYDSCTNVFRECARKASTGKSTVSARSVRDLGG